VSIITAGRIPADTVREGMERQHVDITQDLEGEPVVHAVFDLREDEIAAAAHAVQASCAERFRNTEMSADDVLEYRELTALADELAELAGAGHGTLVMRPARLNAFRVALGSFVESRDESDWLRDEDREPLAISRSLLFPLEELSAEAMRAALDPVPRSV
jgi:hypothetical protein